MTRRISCVALAATLAGCAAAPVPADKLARAEETLRLAERMPDAEVDPRAQHHLALARTELSAGKRHLRDGENTDARRVLLRAEADAVAALHLAHAHAARVDAQRTIEAIRQEMSRLGQGGSGS